MSGLIQRLEDNAHGEYQRGPMLEAAEMLRRMKDVVESAASIGLHVWPDGACRCSQCQLVREAKSTLEALGR